MKTLTACVVLALAATTWAVSPPAIGTVVDCSKYRRIGSAVICSREFKPVCGIDQRTYSSECIYCILRQKRGIPLRKLHDEKCLDCHYSPICTMEYKPHCGSDGVVYANKCLFCNSVSTSHGTLFLAKYGEC